MEVRFGNYRITSDKYQYMMQEFRGTSLDGKSGEEKDRWDTWGYYGSLNALVIALPDHVIRRSNGNLQQAVAEARSVGEALEKALAEQGVSE